MFNAPSIPNYKSLNVTLIVFNNKFILSASYKHTIMNGVISFAFSCNTTILNSAGLRFYKSASKLLIALSPPLSPPEELPPEVS